MTTIDDKLNYLVENGGGGGGSTNTDPFDFISNNILSAGGYSFNSEKQHTQRYQVITPGLYFCIFMADRSSSGYIISHEGGSVIERWRGTQSYVELSRIDNNQTLSITVSSTYYNTAHIIVIPYIAYMNGVDFAQLYRDNKLSLDFSKLMFTTILTGGTVSLQGLSKGKYLIIKDDTSYNNIGGEGTISVSNGTILKSANYGRNTRIAIAEVEDGCTASINVTGYSNSANGVFFAIPFN